MNEAEKVEAAGFMDDEADVIESRGPQSAIVDPGSLNFASMAREPIEQPVPQADPYGRAPQTPAGPPIPAGRGHANALTEAMEVALRARNASEGRQTSQTLTEDYDEPQAPRKPRTRRLYEKKGKPRRKLAEAKGAVRSGDIVEHKDFGVIGEVLETSKKGMKVDLRHVGIVEVTRETRHKYQIIAKGV